MTLADKITLARLGLMPIAVAAYLLLPGFWCVWVAGLVCALAEYTDLLDGRIARARGEVSDFGKLADPFCDVLYRLGMFLTLLLPTGGALFVIDGVHRTIADVPGQLIFVDPTGGHAAVGLVPWLPVFLMVQREIIAGALRAMTATKGLVLAARTSGKIKAWIQGVTLITCLAFPAVFFSTDTWILHWAFWSTWICAGLSLISICEYMWVNRAILAQLIQRHPQPTETSR